MTSAEKQTKFFRPKKTRFSGALTLKYRIFRIKDRGYYLKKNSEGEGTIRVRGLFEFCKILNFF